MNLALKSPEQQVLDIAEDSAQRVNILANLLQEHDLVEARHLSLVSRLNATKAKKGLDLGA